MGGFERVLKSELKFVRRFSRRRDAETQRKPHDRASEVFSAPLRLCVEKTVASWCALPCLLTSPPKCYKLARVNKNPFLHVVLLAVCSAAIAQTRQVTVADYAHAEKFMGYNTNQLVLRTGVRPNWLPDERFWYRVTTGVPADGAAESAPAEFILVDPVAHTRQPAFDHAKLAATLSAVAGEKYTADRLPFTEITFSDDGHSVSFTAATKQIGRASCRERV